jgi:hypothetical protein
MLPCVGWHQAIQVNSPRIAQERHLKPPGSDLIGEALAPVWTNGEALALAGSHLQMVA